MIPQSRNVGMRFYEIHHHFLSFCCWFLFSSAVSQTVVREENITLLEKRAQLAGLEMEMEISGITIIKLFSVVPTDPLILDSHKASLESHIVRRKEFKKRRDTCPWVGRQDHLQST